MISAEKSYDSLPNFTAADAMRLLGIGRNQYIELMNQVNLRRRMIVFAGIVSRSSRSEPLESPPVSSLAAAARAAAGAACLRGEKLVCIDFPNHENGVEGY